MRTKKLDRITSSDGEFFLGRRLVREGDSIRFSGDASMVTLELLATRYGVQLGYREKTRQRGRTVTKTHTLNNALGGKAEFISERAGVCKHGGPVDADCDLCDAEAVAQEVVDESDKLEQRRGGGVE
jgi:hypothetical protein